MKGTFFQRPLEFGLNIQGESWIQGDTVEGSLHVKNHGQDPYSPQDLSISLAYGEFKKVKSNQSDAFKNLDRLNLKEQLPSGHLPPNETQSFTWRFVLPKDCPISEKAGSLYVLCSDKNDEKVAGHLQLQVDPNEVMTNFLEVFKTFFRSSIVSLKNKKGWVEAKIKLPQTKEFLAVDRFLVLMRLDDQQLELKYNFKIKKLAYGDGAVNTQKNIIEYKQELGPKDYLIFNDAPNQDKMREYISDILEQIKRKIIY